MVVEALPDMPAGSAHADEIPMAATSSLAPFAPVELPSVLPTLPEVIAEAEPEAGQESAHAVAPGPEQQGQQPGGVEPIFVDAAVEAAEGPVPAAPEAAATPAPQTALVVATQGRTRQHRNTAAARHRGRARGRTGNTRIRCTKHDSGIAGHDRSR